MAHKLPRFTKKKSFYAMPSSLEESRVRVTVGEQRGKDFSKMTPEEKEKLKEAMYAVMDNIFLCSRH
jgi:hypothetical protein